MLRPGHDSDRNLGVWQKKIVFTRLFKKEVTVPLIAPRTVSMIAVVRFIAVPKDEFSVTTSPSIRAKVRLSASGSHVH